MMGLPRQSSGRVCSRLNQETFRSRIVFNIKLNSSTATAEAVRSVTRLVSNVCLDVTLHNLKVLCDKLFCRIQDSPPGLRAGHTLLFLQWEEDKVTRRGSSSIRTALKKFPHRGEKKEKQSEARRGKHRAVSSSADVYPQLGRDMHSVGKSWLLLTGFILFYVIYLLFGALVFSSIERPMEEKLRHDLEILREEFLNQSCVNAASLEQFLVQVVKASKYGVSVLRNSSEMSNWDLASSMFFANTLVTTVGESELE